MKVSEEKIREITIEVINKLGDRATPDAVKKEVESILASSLDNFKKEENDNSSGRIILTSFGINHPGVDSSISSALSRTNCDIQDITQKILQEFFTMIMIVDITNSPKDLKGIQEDMNKIAGELNIKIYLQHEDVFRYMHRL